MERRPEGRHTSMGGEGVARIGDARTIFVVSEVTLRYKQFISLQLEH